MVFWVTDPRKFPSIKACPWWSCRWSRWPTHQNRSPSHHLLSPICLDGTTVISPVDRVPGPLARADRRHRSSLPYRIFLIEKAIRKIANFLSFQQSISLSLHDRTVVRKGAEILTNWVFASASQCHYRRVPVEPACPSEKVDLWAGLFYLTFGFSQRPQYSLTVCYILFAGY